MHAIEDTDGVLVISSLEASSPISVVDLLEDEDRHSSAASGMPAPVLVCEEEMLVRVCVGEASSQTRVDVTDAELHEVTAVSEQSTGARVRAVALDGQTGGEAPVAPEVEQSSGRINSSVAMDGDVAVEPTLGAFASAGERSYSSGLQPTCTLVQLALVGGGNEALPLSSCGSPSLASRSDHYMCSGVASVVGGGGDTSLDVLSQLQRILLSYPRRGACDVVDFDPRRVLGDAMIRYKTLVPKGRLVDAVDGLIRMRLVEEVNERLTITEDGRAVDPRSETVEHGTAGWHVRSFRKRCWNDIAGDEVALREAVRIKVGAGCFPRGMRSCRT